MPVRRRPSAVPRDALAARWRPALRLVAAAASVVLLVRLVAAGGEGVVAALDAVWRQRPGAVVVPLVLVTAWVLALAEVQRASARALGAEVSRRDALRISRAAFTLSRVVPGGGAAGGVFAVRELARLGHRPGVAGGVAIVSWAVTATALAAVVAVGAGIVVADGVVPAAAVLPGATLLLALAAAGAVVLRTVVDPRSRRRWRRRLETPAPGRDHRAAVRRHRTTGRVRRMVGRLRLTAAGALADLDVRGRPLGSLRTAAAWAGLAYLLEAALLWSVFAAVGVPLPLPVLAAGFLSAGLVNSAPELTPGWIGVYEAAMTATYTALGVPADQAVVGVLVHRLVAFWLPVAVGIVPAVRSLAAGRRAAVAPSPDHDEGDGCAPRATRAVAA